MRPSRIFEFAPTVITTYSLKSCASGVTWLWFALVVPVMKLVSSVGEVM
jgi:hypothetical protein